MQKLTSTVTSLIRLLDVPGSIASTGPIFLTAPTNPVASFNSLMAASPGVSFSCTRPVPTHSSQQNKWTTKIEDFKIVPMSSEVLCVTYSTHSQTAAKGIRTRSNATSRFAFYNFFRLEFGILYRAQIKLACQWPRMRKNNLTFLVYKTFPLHKNLWRLTTKKCLV